MKQRIYRSLKLAGLCTSKAGAQEFMQRNNVEVDGKRITSVLYVVDDRKRIYVNDREIRPTYEKVYLILNKPKGYTCMAFDEYNRPYVMELIRETEVLTRELLAAMFPVGRLDIDTEGLIVITNDGQLAHNILNPESEIEKEYEVLIEGILIIDKVRALEKGVGIELFNKGKKDIYRTQPCKIIMRDVKDEKTKLNIIIEEGKKRQIRKMFEAVGHRVLKLKRLRIGGLSMPTELRPGHIKMISEQKIYEKIFNQR